MTDPIQTSAPPLRKRRRFLRAALVFFLLLFTLFWFTPAIIARTSLRHRIIDSSLVDLNGKVRCESASMSWFGSVELREVTFTEPSGRVAVTAPKLTTSKTLLQLATQRGDLGTFHIENPEILITFENGASNIEEWISNYTKDDGTPPKPERLAFAIEAIGGKATIKGVADSHLSSVKYSFRSPKSRAQPLEMQVAAEAATGGKIDTFMQFGALGAIRVSASAFPLGVIAQVLPDYAPGIDVVGMLTCELDAKWRTASDKPTTLDASGSANITDFALRAPLLQGETLALKSVALLPSDIRTLESGAVEVKSLKLLCDVGDASVSGLFDPSFDLAKLLNQPGVTANAHVDLAKLAALLPKLLRIRSDTIIRGGAVDVTLKSEANAGGTLWIGDVRTRDIEALRGQQVLTWKTPLQGSFRGRLREDGLPDFEDVKLLSEFVSIAGRGQPESFTAAARLDLAKLAAQLEQFVDLDGLKMAGEGIVRVNAKPVPGTGTTELRGSIDLAKLEIRDGSRLLLAEPELHVTLDAVGARLAKSARIDSGSFAIFTDPKRPELDRLTVTLKEPIADVAALSGGAADVLLTGELSAWKARLGALVGFPKEYDFGGRGRIAGTVKVNAGSFVGEKLTVDLKDARFAGKGVNFAEPTLHLGATGTYDRATKGLALADIRIASATLGASAARLAVTRDTANGYGISGPITVDYLALDRLQQALRLGSEPIRGTAKGTVTLNANAAKTAFDADLKIDNFAFGPVAKPTWTEPWVTVKGSGDFDAAGDKLALKSTKVARDGFAVDATGSVAKLATEMELDLTGNLTYDLAKIEPQLKEYLGKGGQVSGQGTKPFSISGDLSDGGKNLAVRVGEPKRNLAGLKGNVAVGWKTLKAYGFDVGEAELKANVGDGRVKVDRIEALFGGGKVKLEPTLLLNPGAYDLSFAKGTVVEKAKLTPAACADAIGYALPAIANVAQAAGTFSFELADNRIPLATPTKGLLGGTLVIHEAEVSPGPIVAQIAEMLGSKPLKLQLTKDQRVPILFSEGRVHHKDFAIAVDGFTVKTSGSVGVDGTLALVLEVPLTGKLAASLAPDQPRVRDALAKQVVKVAISGTLAKPQLDQRAFRKIVGDTLRGAAKDLAKDATEDFIRKGLEKFLPKK